MVSSTRGNGVRAASVEEPGRVWGVGVGVMTNRQKISTLCKFSAEIENINSIHTHRVWCGFIAIFCAHIHPYSHWPPYLVRLLQSASVSQPANHMAARLSAFRNEAPSERQNGREWTEATLNRAWLLVPDGLVWVFQLGFSTLHPGLQTIGPKRENIQYHWVCWWVGRLVGDEILVTTCFNQSLQISIVER